MAGGSSRRYPPELRERAVRMVAEVRVQPHLATFPSAAASAVGQRMAPRDGRPLHRLERDHPGLPRPPPERELGQDFPPQPTHNTRTISPPINLTVPDGVHVSVPPLCCEAGNERTAR